MVKHRGRRRFRGLPRLRTTGSPPAAELAPIAVNRSTRADEAALRAAITTANPVWPNAPTAGAFLPLMLLFTAILPSLHLWLYSRLTPELAQWGLQALSTETGDVRDGAGPPLFHWCIRLALIVPLADKSLALAAPSCFAATARARPFCRCAEKC